MPKGYVIITEAIHDPEGMVTYGEASTASVIEHGAKVLSVDEHPQVLEGEWHGTQTVVLEFESVEAAREWYNSDTYQEAAKLRQAAADCNGVIVAGLG